MQIRNSKASRRVKLSMNKFLSFSAEGKFSVEINTECLHAVPQAYQTVFVRSQHAPYNMYKYSNFLANRYCKYLSFLKSAFTAVYLQ